MDRKNLISLRRVLSHAEYELGISDLSDAEKKFYYAALECSDEFGNFTSDAVRASEWCANIPHATYHRVIAKFLKSARIRKISGTGRNRYTLVSN